MSGQKDVRSLKKGLKINEKFDTKCLKTVQ